MPSRVLLINANRYDWPYPVFPLGLAHLAAHLRQAGHEIRWVDLLAGEPSLPQVVREFRPQVTGISLRNIDDVLINTQETFFQGLGGMVERLRQMGAGAVVLGGSGFSIFPRELFDLANADFGIQGEGEESFSALLEALAGGRDWSNIPGLVFRQDGVIRLNPPRRLTGPGSSDPANLPPELVEFYLARSSMLNLQTQRGCAHRCSYCTYPMIEGSTSRHRPAEEVAADLGHLARRGAPYVFIVDSVFNSSPERVAAICEEILRQGVKIKWGCFLRPQGLSTELARLMARAGLAHVEFGSDSFCDSVLRAFAKGLTFQDIWEASSSLQQAGADYCHFLICGGPGETDATLRQTFANSLRLPGGVIMAVVGVRLYPQTPLTRSLVRQGQNLPARDLLSPKYYLAPGLTQEGIFSQLQEFSRRHPQWIVGDPPASYLKMAERLRQRGVIGPLWSYFAAMQRLIPALRPVPA